MMRDSMSCCETKINYNVVLLNFPTTYLCSKGELKHNEAANQFYIYCRSRTMLPDIIFPYFFNCTYIIKIDRLYIRINFGKLEKNHNEQEA